jgi:hypothetical protein
MSFRLPSEIDLMTIMMEYIRSVVDNFKLDEANILTQGGHSRVRIPADPAGNGIFPESFRPVPLILLREPVVKPTEDGSSIPDGISRYHKQDYSHFVPEAENLRKRMDLTGNDREHPGNPTYPDGFK